MRYYELGNHLGNVLTVLTDLQLGKDVNADGFVDHYYGELASVRDYFPFGMPAAGRAFVSVGYRFGFNSKGYDPEFNGGGAGAVYDYGFRIYDSRIGKFLSVDPLSFSYAMLSPFQYASNSPIFMIDLDGLEGTEPAGHGSSDLEMQGNPSHAYVSKGIEVNDQAGRNVDQGWTDFMRDMVNSGSWEVYVEDLYQANINSQNTGVGRAIYGVGRDGNVLLNNAAKEIARRNAEESALPSLKISYAMQVSGYTWWNPASYITFMHTRASIVTTSEEGADLVNEVSVHVAFAWASHILGGGFRVTRNPPKISLKPKESYVPLIPLADDAAKSSTSLVETASGILKPGGNIIGKAGSNASIRELSGGIEAAQSYWSRLVTSGAKPVLGSSYKGTLMQLPNGGTVGFRTMMSRSPGTAATIDVNIPGFFQGKLKFNP